MATLELIDQLRRARRALRAALERPGISPGEEAGREHAQILDLVAPDGDGRAAGGGGARGHTRDRVLALGREEAAMNGGDGSESQQD